MRAAIIVQARMTSTRLPGKILLEVLEKPLLEYQTERLARVALAQETVLATTTNASDEPILRFAERLGLRCFRGSEEDVLSRYHGAALMAGADVVVRVTSDCPLIDPAAVDEVLASLTADPDLDYVSNVLERTYPRGMDCEAFTFRALDMAHREATLRPEREHVTPFIYTRPERFRIAGVRRADNQSRHRWTVDTPEDFELIRRILTEVYPANPRFSLEDCLAAVERHPDWPLLNARIEQKKTFC